MIAAEQHPAPLDIEDHDLVDERLEMPLPKHELPLAGEDSMEMVDRVKRWEEFFKRSAERALRAVRGYERATVTDYRWLAMEPGHDENDYELSVQVGSGSDKVGEESASTVKIVVRRVSEDSLQS
jgi:hypothetical protein